MQCFEKFSLHNNFYTVLCYSRSMTGSVSQLKTIYQYYKYWYNSKTRKNCFLCLPLNAAICTTIYLERQKCYGPDKKILFKKPLFDLEVKGQGPMKVITVCDTLPYGHAPTYEISLTYLERQTSYGPDKLCWEEAEEKIRLKQYVSLRSKGRHNNQAIILYLFFSTHNYRNQYLEHTHVLHSLIQTILPKHIY